MRNIICIKHEIASIVFTITLDGPVNSENLDNFENTN